MTPLSFSMAMTPDEDSCRCVMARGAATLEAAMARVAMGAVLVASILLDEIMLLEFSIDFLYYVEIRA